MHDGVARPRALLSRRAVDVAVHRADRDRTAADGVDCVEPGIAALEVRAAADRIQPFADAHRMHFRAGWRIERNATATVEVERFDFTARAIADERDGHDVVRLVRGAARNQL